MKIIQGSNCFAWIEAPRILHKITEKLFEFLFGGNWNEPLASSLGYLALIIYAIGLLQWLFIRLPRHGRVAGGF